MGVIGQVVGAIGPWAALFAFGITIILMVARNKLIPEATVKERLSDKQQIVDFHTATTQRLLDAIEERERNVELLIKQLSALAATLNGGEK